MAIVASLLLALGAGIFLGVDSCAVRTQRSTSTISSSELAPEASVKSQGGCLSLPESQDQAVWWVLAAPGLLAAVGLAGLYFGFRWLAWLVAIVLLLLVLLTGFSIGLLFFPAALLLLLGAGLQHAEFGPPQSRNLPPDGEN
ncbi:MAG TPA: hypothetical protein VNA87_01245 [Actinomycetota bacterium]|nr:hypothetical protein [Actinomycetota bacterium]